MIERKLARLGASSAVAMIAVVFLSIPATAQDLPFDQLVMRVPCCRCVDGSEQSLDLSTGLSPWRVTSPAGATATAVSTPFVLFPGNWTSMPPATWIRHPTAQGPGNYIYELLVFVPRCLIPARVRLTGQLAAAKGGSIELNARPLASTHPTAGFMFSVVMPATVLPRGVNTIRVRVNNTGGRMGLLMRGAAVFTCPSHVEVIEAQVAPSH